MLLRFSLQYISYISQSSEKINVFTLPDPVNERSEHVRYLLIKDTLLSFQVVPVVVHVILQYRFLSFTRDMTSIFVAGSVCESARKSRPYRFGVIVTAIVKLSLLEGKFSTENTRSMLTLKIHVYIFFRFSSKRRQI